MSARLCLLRDLSSGCAKLVNIQLTTAMAFIFVLWRPNGTEEGRKIMEWLGLEGTFKDHLVQLHYHGRGHLSLCQVTQSPVQSDLEPLQEGTSTSGQPISVSHHPHRKKCLPCKIIEHVVVAELK